MLLNHFFTIKSHSLTDAASNKYTIAIDLHGEHPVYEGHFPGNPVAPGVCLMQMVKETATFLIGNDLAIKQADTIKFMAVVNPIEHQHVTLDIQLKEVEIGVWKADSVLYSGDTVFFKLKAIFIS